jgi:hypothetical protein
LSSIVIDSYRCFGVYLEEFNRFKKQKKCSFEIIDRLEKDLFDLKNITHDFFRKKMEEKDVIEETDVYDLIVSSIFHEMLHLKEYIYILEKYEPHYTILENNWENVKLDTYKKNFLRHSREIVGEAKLGLPLKMQEIHGLVKDAIYQIEQIIRNNAIDNQMIRSIYFSSDIIDRIYPEGGIKHLHEIVYEGSWIEGYYLVAESLKRNGFIEEAKKILSNIIRDTVQLSEKDDKYQLKKNLIIRVKAEL